jgi:hypothetical protein
VPTFTSFSFALFTHSNWNFGVFYYRACHYYLISKRRNMGNAQPGGTSHHFINNSSVDGSQTKKRNSTVWTKNGRIPASKQQSTNASWQLARDVSMEMLSRKTTKLNLRQGKNYFII